MTIDDRRKRTPATADDEPRFLRIVDDRWESHVGAELRSTRRDGSTPKYKLPWRHVKLNTSDLDTLGHLTLAEYGAYCRLVGAAALTDNATPYRPAWLRRRFGLDQRAIGALMALGLAKIEPASAGARDEQKSEEKQANDPPPPGQNPGTVATLPAREGEGEEEEEKIKRGEAPHVDNSASPAPPRKSNGHDARPFETIKTLVLKLATHFKTTDPDQLHKLGGQSHRLSRNQCRVAMKQLREDGKL